MIRWLETVARRVAAPVVASLVLLIAGSPAFAADLRVAVAANFGAPAQQLAEAFEAETGTRVAISTGSSGALFAQITQGAPFAILLSADEARPKALVDQGFAVKGSQFTYALGRLVLWSPDAELIDSSPAILETDRFSHLAIANPQTAPYGAAAMEVLGALGLEEELAVRIVTGESIAQAFGFVQSGNAELGFIASSQLATAGGGSIWIVPEELHAPIRQDAVLLEAGNDDAKAFLDFLRSSKGREIVAQFGYGLVETTQPAPSIYG
ncbi:MAG: molybdate ABC transporter substrate-binding protein [Alphaproteobacteria bacterium]|nr:molybdate ABC transporter substrate-binding protein [Alphaproteobacteria bacterium]